MKHSDIAAWVAALGTTGGLILASYSGVFSLGEGQAKALAGEEVLQVQVDILTRRVDNLEATIHRSQAWNGER